MAKEEYILVGKTRKTHGVKGGIRLQIKDEFVEDVLNVNVAFLKLQGKLIPHFIEHFDYTNNLIVKFEDIDSPEAASPVTSKEFYIRSEDISHTTSSETTALQFAKLLGFSITDVNHGLIGKIKDVLDLPQQEMASVLFKEKDILIPLHEKLIVSVDYENKTLLMDLPEGLLQL